MSYVEARTDDDGQDLQAIRRRQNRWSRRNSYHSP
jgi:hypothetical protein